MQHFLEKLDFYADVSSRIVKGEKIDPRDYNPILIQDFKLIAARMYTGFFTPLEPQSLFIEEGWGQKEMNDMGMTYSHPRMGALLREARAVLAKSEAAYIFGYKAAGRSLIALSGHTRSTTSSVLTKGDYVSLAEATAEIQYRLNHPQNAPFAPLVIQDRKFFGRLFMMEPAAMQDIKKIGVFFSNGVDETRRIIEKNASQISAEPMTHSPYKVANPDNVFSSSDQIKTNHNKTAHNLYSGEFSSAHNLLGPSRIPVEETKSYAGNALVKMVALMQLSLKRMKGSETPDTLLSVHDGGVSAFLMNEKGERYTQLFTDKNYFPTSAENMNSILAGPGVELAELYKSATSFKTVMDALFLKVDEVCKYDKRFKPSDLCGMDTAIQMAIPAREFFDLYEQYAERYPSLKEEEICEYIALKHAVIVGETQRVNILREPKYNAEPLSLDTENYIEAEGYPGKSRAQIAEWIAKGPNAASYHMLMEAVGAKPIGGEGQQSYWREGKINIKIAVPGMLSGGGCKRYK